jgi:hypothetical protein
MKLKDMGKAKILKKAKAGLIGDRKMKVVHMRDGYGSTSRCQHIGVHTTRKPEQVGCIYCQALMERAKRMRG